MRAAMRARLLTAAVLGACAVPAAGFAARAAPGLAPSPARSACRNTPRAAALRLRAPSALPRHPAPQLRPRTVCGARQLSALEFSPAAALAAYTRLLQSDPVATKIATAAVLGAAGDAVAQLTEAAQKRSELLSAFDANRALSMVAFSAVYTGAFQAWWIGTLQENVHLADPIADAAVKTGLCQFGTIPLVYMPTFFLITGAVRGMDLQTAVENAKAQYFRIYLRNVGYWIPVQMVQFFYLPQEWHITFLCVAGFVWSIILSSVALSGQPASPEPAAAAQALDAAPQSRPPLSSQEVAPEEPQEVR